MAVYEKHAARTEGFYERARERLREVGDAKGDVVMGGIVGGGRGGGGGGGERGVGVGGGGAGPTGMIDATRDPRLRR